jgi:hypothetical protein
MKWKRRDRVIRQAISCDICGTEMMNANHWFVARATGRELRISAWDPQNRLRSLKHLCGHKCLHKLLDDFTAQTLSVNIATTESQAATVAGTGRIDSRVNLPAAVPIHSRQPVDSRATEVASSAHMVAPSEQGARAPLMPHSLLHADAWKRERERQQRAAGKRSIA